MVKIYNALHTDSLNGEWTNVNSDDTITINYEEKTCENSLTIPRMKMVATYLLLLGTVKRRKRKIRPLRVSATDIVTRGVVYVRNVVSF